LIGLDVFDGSGVPTVNMAKAVNWLISQKKLGANIVAFNLSIQNGLSYPTACADDIGFGAARAVGMVPVVAAGNNGSTSGVSYPACIPGALSVGAVYDTNWIGGMNWQPCSDLTMNRDQVICFSQSGPNLKMLAPGSFITAAGYTESGTSQAAPHVAGAIAVMAAARPAAPASWWESAVVNSGPLLLDRDGRQRHRLDLMSSLTTLSADQTLPVVIAPTPSFGCIPAHSPPANPRSTSPGVLRMHTGSALPTCTSKPTQEPS
jgi:subtilisin family serine protease